jgi:hypothetical protein
MDTKFWGPPAWRLLHLIAAAKKTYRPFWDLLPFVLPCKFCRASLTGYYEKLPLEAPLDKWLWKVHNQVNAKLRGQGQKLPADPAFSVVRRVYQERLDAGCTRTEFPGWEFLFCIADNHPAMSPSAPMPDCKDEEICDIDVMSSHEKNKKNLLTPEERMEYITQFFEAIPHVLPFPEWKASWNKHATRAGSVREAMKQRSTILTWLYTIRCGMEQDLGQLNKESFYGLCKELKKHRSGCGKSRRARTCRKQTRRKHE